MNSAPTTVTENSSTSNGTTSIPTWFIGTTVGCSFAFLILGIIIGGLIKRWYDKRRTRNGRDPTNLSEEGQFLLNESPAVAHLNDGEEDVSPGDTNFEFHASSDHGQIMQTHGHLSEAPLAVAEALPHNPEDVPLKGSIRALDPKYYEEKFRVLGFRNKYEPNVEPNCLFEAITKARNCDLADDDVVEHAKFMRHRVAHFIEQHQAQFRDSIANLSSNVGEYLERLKNPAQPCDEVVIHAIGLSEKLSIQLVHVDGIGNMFHCSSDQDQRKVIYIGHVERNYFLLLEPTWERRDGDVGASSNRLPVSDSRVESNYQSVPNHPEGTDRQQPSVLPLLGQFDTIPEMDLSDHLDDDVHSGSSQEYDSNSSSDDDENDLDEERIRLSENLVMFPHQKLAQHRNVVAGEMRSILPDQNRQVVIKFDSNQVTREITAILKLGSHSNIVNLIDSGFLSDDLLSTQYIVLQRYHDLNLEDYVLCDDAQPLYDINRGFKFCRQIINGMKFIHKKFIIHKDLKPSNILLSDNLENAVIADFGSSQEVNSKDSKVRSCGIFGTLGYRPPESLNMSYVSLKSDNYSLGVVFYFLLSKGMSPFGPQSDSWDHNTKHGVINVSLLLVTNPLAMKHLLVSMMNKERCRRPSIEDIECHLCWSGNEDFLNFTYPFEEEFETRQDISSTEEIDNSFNDGLRIWQATLKHYEPAAPSSTTRLDLPSYGLAAAANGQQTEKFSTDSQVSGSTNSVQDPDETAVKVLLDETAARSMLENDLALFKSSYNQKELKKISTNPDILHEALKSSDYLKTMCNYLIDHISSSELKTMLRSLQLLHDEDIEDIESEIPKDSEEHKRLFLQKMRHSFGDDINPRILLEKTSEYRMRMPYDVLCRGFVNHFKRSNQPTTT